MSMAEGFAYISWNPSMGGLVGPSYPGAFESQSPYKVGASIHWCCVEETRKKTQTHALIMIGPAVCKLMSCNRIVQLSCGNKKKKKKKLN